jgi:RNA polymerase sigma factor (sigma-70 family)
MATRRWGEFLLHLRWGTVRPDGPSPTDGALLRRFAEGRDEAAFALLVQRHGPTVFGVCCRILGPGPDAEDAFQATFVVLARKAAVLADRAIVGNWLFGVARRTALKARAMAARRRAKERDMARPESHPPAHPGELREAIDAAVAGLPTKYQAPVVLCELEGRSLREAAAELGWPEGTVAGRLSRGRALLRARLVRAGLPAAAGVAAAVPVPGALAAAAVRAGCVVAGGDGVIQPAVAALADGVQRQMALARLVPIGVGLGITLTAAAAIAIHGGNPTPPVGPPAVAAAAPVLVAPRPAVDALGDPLPAGAVARFGTSRLRHGGDLYALAFTADGTGLVGGGNQWANQVWDVATGRHRSIITPDRLISSAVGVSRDGGRVAGWTDARMCVVWDTATGKEVRRLALEKSVLRAMAVAPDGRVAAGSQDALEIHAPDGTVVRRPAPGCPAALVFSADGSRLGVAELDGTVAVVNTSTGDATHRLRVERNATAITFSPAEAALIVGTNHAVYVFDLRTGARARRVGPGATALAMAPDGGLLATADYDGLVRLWDWRTGTVVRDFAADKGTRALAFSPDGTTLATGGAWQAVRLFDSATGRERQPATGPTASVRNFGLSADGRRLVTSAGDGLQIWDPAAGRAAGPRAAIQDPMRLAVSPDGTRVARAINGRILVWDPHTGREVCEWDAPPGALYALGYTPDGTALVGALDNNLRVWDAVTGETRSALVQKDGSLRSLGIGGGNGAGVAAGYHDGSAAIWDLNTAQVTRVSRPGPADRGSAYGVAYDPGRRILAVVTLARVRVCDTETMAERWSIPRRCDDAGWSPVALSADGRWLAYADGPTAYLVNLETGGVARTYRGHIAAVTALAFAPDSDRLYSASLDTTVLAWVVGPPAP